MAVGGQDVQSRGAVRAAPADGRRGQRQRVGRGPRQRVGDRLGQGVDVPAPRVEAHDLDAQPLGEDRVVDLDAAARGDVGHRQGDDHRHGQLAHVRGEHQRAPEVRGVADDDDGVDLVATVQQVRGQGLVGGHGVQRVRARAGR